jgi:hypothetical protein
VTTSVGSLFERHLHTRKQISTNAVMAELAQRYIDANALLSPSTSGKPLRCMLLAALDPRSSSPVYSVLCSRLAKTCGHTHPLSVLHISEQRCRAGSRASPLGDPSAENWCRKWPVVFNAVCRLSSRHSTHRHYALPNQPSCQDTSSNARWWPIAQREIMCAFPFCCGGPWPPLPAALPLKLCCTA